MQWFCQAGWSARHDLILTNQLQHLAASRPIRCGGDALVVRGAENTTPVFGQSPLRDVHVHVPGISEAPRVGQVEGMDRI